MIKKIKPQIQELGRERFGVKEAPIIQPDVPQLDADGDPIIVVPDGTIFQPLTEDQEKMNEIIRSYNQLEKRLDRIQTILENKGILPVK